MAAGTAAVPSGMESALDTAATSSELVKGWDGNLIVIQCNRSSEYNDLRDVLFVDRINILPLDDPDCHGGMDHIQNYFSYCHVFHIFKGVGDSMLISQQFAPCLPIILCYPNLEP